MKRFTSENQRIGGLGEQIACKYLIKQGFSIIERNYTKKIGEVDIVCRKDSAIHFVEVKTIVTRVTQVKRSNVSRETSKIDEVYNPFQNITHHKLRKFSRTVEWYLAEKHVSRETRWQIDAIAVVLNYNTRIATINILWNVVA
jgi:putative endonuclease